MNFYIIPTFFISLFPVIPVFSVPPFQTCPYVLKIFLEEVREPDVHVLLICTQVLQLLDDRM
jgi:hypothetical protein